MPRFILSTNYPVAVTFDEHGEPMLSFVWSPRAPEKIKVSIDLGELNNLRRRVELGRILRGEPKPPSPWTGNPVGASSNW